MLESSLSNLNIAASDITGTVTDAQVSDTLTASSAANADKLDGEDSADYVQKTELLWALVDHNGGLVAGHGATAAELDYPRELQGHLQPPGECLRHDGLGD